MPTIKQVCLSALVVVLSIIALKGCASTALNAWDRAYEGERAKITEQYAIEKVLEKNAEEHY